VFLHNRLKALWEKQVSTIKDIPKFLEIVLGGHEEHAKTIQTRTDTEVVDERDPKVSRGQFDRSVVKDVVGFEKHGDSCQNWLDIDVLQNSTLDEQKCVRIAHLCIKSQITQFLR